MTPKEQDPTAEQVEKLFERLAPNIAPQVTPFIAKLFQAYQTSHYLTLLPDEVAQLSQAFPLVGTAKRPAPLIIEENRLYVASVWHAERTVAHALIKRAQVQHEIKTDAVAFLKQLFPEALPQYQQAMLLALRKSLLIIHGAPNTGKTTLAAMLAVLFITYLVQYGELTPRLGLLVNNRQDAYRINCALSKIRVRFSQDAIIDSLLPKEAITPRQLLGRTSTQRPRYNKRHPVTYDVLIVDEASSMTMELMAELVDALPDYTRCILLGDATALPINDDSILTELYHTPTYRQTTLDWFSHQLGTAPTIDTTFDDTLVDCLVSLKPLSTLPVSAAWQTWYQKVIADETALTLPKPQSATSVITWRTLSSEAFVQETLEQKTAYFEAAHQQDPEKAFAAFWHFVSVTPTFLVAYHLNTKQEHLLEKMGKKKPKEAWYIGRPVILVDQNSIDALFVGDIGLTLATESGLRVYFPNIVGKGYLSFHPAHLPKHVTALTLSFHKTLWSSQHLWLWLTDETESVLDQTDLYRIAMSAKESLALLGQDPKVVGKILHRVRPTNKTLRWRQHATPHAASLR